VQVKLYPKSRHGVNEPVLLKHMRELMTDLFGEFVNRLIHTRL
jgi:hypothetical protein